MKKEKSKKSFSKKSTNDTILEEDKILSKFESKEENIKNKKEKITEEVDKKKLSILKYNLLGNKTYTYKRGYYEKIYHKIAKSELPARRDHCGVEINDEKKHKVFFDLKQNKIIQIEKREKKDLKIKQKKVICKCIIF